MSEARVWLSSYPAGVPKYWWQFVSESGPVFRENLENHGSKIAFENMGKGITYRLKKNVWPLEPTFNQGAW